VKSDQREDAKIVVPAGVEAAGSVTGCEDKTSKHPGVFRKAELMVLNQVDLLRHVPFDPKLMLENARLPAPGWNNCSLGSQAARNERTVRN
jgi:Ni2+-binding GTPase involved in maturation of urease and hydrogenase